MFNLLRCGCVAAHVLVATIFIYYSSPPGVGAALYTGSFQSRLWTFDDPSCHHTQQQQQQQVGADCFGGGEAAMEETAATVDHAGSRSKASSVTVTFIVALALRDVDHMKSRLQAVSDPRSPSYGQHLSLRAVHDRYGPLRGDRDRVLRYLRSIDHDAIHADQWGDMITVTAKASAIEQLFRTRLGWVSHSLGVTKRRAVRARDPLTLPSELHPLIDFISLNCPVNHARPRASSVLRRRTMRQEEEEEEEETSRSLSALSALRVYPGNEEAYVYFQPLCGLDALSPINSQSPPCSNGSQPMDRPSHYQFVVSKHADSGAELDLQPIVQTLRYSSIGCFDRKGNPCRSSADCTCIAKLSSLPKYVQLRVAVHAVYSPGENSNASSSSTASSTHSLEQFLGASLLFALTDVATPAFLSALYGMPPGLSVQHGSNQSVAEFYGEFYSSEDLNSFMSLSGLPSASIPPEHVFGDLPNDPSHPGGEAQLDVEYIMAMAPGAATFFYSFSDLNPSDSSNEGFLQYVQYVNGQPYPPLVHSLSYGDVEADVFLTEESSAYGYRVDAEFVKMGLRGLTVVFSSGDDGIGDFTIRNDPAAACRRANPSWPAASPFVTSVGATQLTDKYLPVCGEPYSTAHLSVSTASRLTLQCSGVGETACSSTLGGIITTGGGFSAVYDRSSSAPWQADAVDRYLEAANSAAYPPKSFFNAAGRGYPDVSTYGSNYLVVLNGEVIRESGTSASAPVFAAMVTLWNDIRLAYGRPPLGFINPFLYQLQAQTPTAFRDVVTGNNSCGVGSSIESVHCCNYSFAASSGWDAVTGLGSPNFQIIAETMLGNTASAFPYLGAAGRSAEDSDRDSVAHESLSLSIAALCVSALCLLAAVAVVAYSRYTQTSSSYQHSSSYNDSSHDDSSVLNENPQGEQLQLQQQASVANPLRSSGDKHVYAKI